MNIYDLFKEDLERVVDICQSSNVAISWNNNRISVWDSGGKPICYFDDPETPITFKYLEGMIRELLHEV